MREITVVCAYKRDPLLYLCLEAIRAQAPEMEVQVFSDRGECSSELLVTCSKFNAALNVRQGAIGYGNSQNVVGALLSASEGADIVHSIEDDTILHPGYFDWARTELAKPRPGFSALPFKYAVALGRIPGDVNSTWYESPCASWNASALRICLEIIPEGYLQATTREEMQKNLDGCEHFKGSRYRYGSAEQDGFFLRCLERFMWKTAYPPKSFASHIGWWGYNRPELMGPPPGTFEQQVEACRKFLYDKKGRTYLFGQRITENEMGGM